jgi:uncharacterized protein (TIRG00374 family)
MRRALTLGALALVIFGWLLPKFIDYGQVWQALKGLEWWQFVVLVVLGLARIPTEAMVYRALLPALRLSDAMRTWLMVTGGSTFLPPPADSAAFYALTRSYGIARAPAATASFLTFLYPTVGRLVLPVLVVVPFVVFAVADDETLPVFLITLTVAVALGTLGWIAIRSEHGARRLGDMSARLVNWGLARLRRRPVASFAPALARFREDAISIVRRNWRAAALSVAANFSIIFAILLLALRFVGLSDEQLPWIEVLAAFALSQWAQTVIPLSPGGLGIADAVLLGCLSTVAPGNASAITAALVVWRIFSWALPIPIGLIAIQRWQAAHPGALAEAREAFRSRPTDDGSARA